MVTITSLIFLVSSDFRCRTVSLWVLLIFGCLIAINALACQNPVFVLWNVTLNCAVLTLLWLSFMFYAVVKRCVLRGNIQKFVGVGDILFLLFLTPVFEINVFVYFLLVGFSASIVYWLISRKATIPLVGTMGIEFGVYLFLYSDLWQIY